MDAAKPGNPEPDQRQIEWPAFEAPLSDLADLAAAAGPGDTEVPPQSTSGVAVAADRLRGSLWESREECVAGEDGPAAPTYYAVDPRQVALERVESSIVAGVLLVGGSVGAVITGFVFQFSLLWWLSVGGGGTLLVALVMLLFIWPPIRLRHVRWKLDAVGLEIQRGVFWRHVISVPLARLQHADISQGPLQRYWGLATLIVYTAGTQQASVDLDALAYETAVALRDELLRQQGATDVV